MIGREIPVVDKVEGMKDALIVNGVLHRFGKTPLPDMPVNMTVKQSIVNGSEPSAIHPKNSNKEGGEKVMTLNELRESYPDLVKEIEDEATKAACTKNEENVQASVQNALKTERNRIREIDSIAKMVGDPEMVDKAKYEEPMNASELALKAMQAQQAAGNEYIKNRAEELKATEDVEVSPNGGMEDNVAQDAAELNALIAKLKKEA